MNKESPPKRQSIRFKPDENTLVYIKKLGDSESSNIDSIGLVYSEASKGFGCLTLKDNVPKQGEDCLVKVGDLPARKAKVAYSIAIDEDSFKLGFEYL